MSLTYRRAVRALIRGSEEAWKSAILQNITHISAFNCTSNDATKELIVEMHGGEGEPPRF